MQFFSSDLHFGNDEALVIDGRPFKNMKSFERYITKLWNKQTTKDDDIYVIGDFVDYHANKVCNWHRGLSVVKKLKAKVHLIVGNNEQKLINAVFDQDYQKFKDYCLNMGFASVEHNDIIDLCGQKFYLTHRPREHHDSLLTLFGHCHRAMGVYKSFGFNIGCDLNHFRLFSEADIQKFLYQKQHYWDIDENLKLI